MKCSQWRIYYSMIFIISDYRDFEFLLNLPIEFLTVTDSYFSSFVIYLKGNVGAIVNIWKNRVNDSIRTVKTPIFIFGRYWLILKKNKIELNNTFFQQKSKKLKNISFTIFWFNLVLYFQSYFFGLWFSKNAI